MKWLDRIPRWAIWVVALLGAGAYVIIVTITTLLLGLVGEHTEAHVLSVIVLGAVLSPIVFPFYNLALNNKARLILVWLGLLSWTVQTLFWITDFRPTFLESIDNGVGALPFIVLFIFMISILNSTAVSISIYTAIFKRNFKPLVILVFTVLLHLSPQQHLMFRLSAECMNNVQAEAMLLDPDQLSGSAGSCGNISWTSIEKIDDNFYRYHGAGGLYADGLLWTDQPSTQDCPVNNCERSSIKSVGDGWIFYKRTSTAN